MQVNILREVSRTFALTIPMLNAPLIPVITDAYLFLRILDTIEDEEALDFEDQKKFIKIWTEVLRNPSCVPSFVQQILPLLTKSTKQAERLLVEDASALIERILQYDKAIQESIYRVGKVMGNGMLKFLERKGDDRVRTMQELEEYCYYVAGCVGEMLTEIFCFVGNFEQKKGALLKLSDDFGKGLQLTNILKDVEQDRKRGVEWIPLSLRSETGFKNLIDKTRNFLHKALDYICLLPTQERQIRRFCLVNTLLALSTLRTLSKGGKKISKFTLFAHLVVSKVACFSNRMVQWCKNV
jgi:farnesyl-diphosphate farnesyltransferase